MAHQEAHRHVPLAARLAEEAGHSPPWPQHGRHQESGLVLVRKACDLGQMWASQVKFTSEEAEEVFELAPAPYAARRMQSFALSSTPQMLRTAPQMRESG